MFTDREILQMINRAFEDMPFSGKPPELYEPISYIISLGGKRIRPVMLLMTVDMYCGNLRRAMPAALGIELFHNFSLIHDDIMDGAPIRRGKPTVHEKWNDNTAILSWDTMLVKAYEKFLMLPESLIKPALDIFNRTAAEVCEGQQYDMNFESREEVSIDDYLEMIRLKTAVLIGTSLYLGGLTANVPTDDLARLYDFGIHTGLAFQLRDDLLDTYGDEKTFGKIQYGDITANKKTFLYLKSLELSDEQDRRKLQGMFSDPGINREEKIKQTLEIFDKANVRLYTEDKILDHHQLALDAFSGLNLAAERKVILLDYVKMLMGRNI